MTVEAAPWPSTFPSYVASWYRWSMDSDATDAGIRNELARVLAIVEVVTERPDHHAETSSDLAADEARFPDIWAATVARRGLVHAAENFEAACLLMLNGDWTAPQYALLRAAYESAGAATWLLQPGDIDTRLARLLWQHRESWRYSTKAYGGTPLDHDREERQRWADDAAARLGIDLRAGRSGGFENLIEEIDDLPGQPESPADRMAAVLRREPREDVGPERGDHGDRQRRDLRARTDQSANPEPGAVPHRPERGAASGAAGVGLVPHPHHDAAA
ncbi:hypothetical protein MAV_0285 [Mycobacterium avium 104]|uniref:Uncharacterized protein n=1 Tax=Mycobacterium avium (strain 104) TaxID=243243 RepID=A0A0H3A267_MYCA1|nr:hypothetical protein [Mycobacterium avium]ABK68163.1 hypothetical protein MAV_0285 [Mycobacterium avium 104]